MMRFIKKIPSVLLFVLLAVVYITCGFVIGYHQGYREGQEDYIIYINNILENNESSKQK
jgi:hypothetical protein